MELEKKYQDSGSEDSDEKLGISYSAIKLLQKKLFLLWNGKGLKNLREKRSYLKICVGKKYNNKVV